MKNSLQFDAKVPASLKAMQEWFGSSITQPLTKEDTLFSTDALASKVDQYIRPSPTLKPIERLQIYSQQYWWRLFNVMQDSYPFLLRLFGYHDFTQSIALPYLLAFPPQDWCLNNLGDNLPLWLKTHYQGNDKALCYGAALLDFSFYNIFFQPVYQAIELPKEIDLLLAKTLYLQPHVYLFDLPFDLFSYRSLFLKETVEFWESNPFPELKKTPTYFILQRTPKGVGWYEMTSSPFTILKHLQNGCSIESICDWIETQPEAVQEEVEKFLQKWFKDWALRKILTDIKDTSHSY